MWHQKVLRQFATVPPPQYASESDFHAPYIKLLQSLFPWESDFVVVPQCMPDSRGRVDFLDMFEVYLENQPVLIVALKPPSHLEYRSKRQLADSQIRERISDLAARCPLKVLHAISAMGTKLCFYSMDTEVNDAEILPIAIPRHPTRVNNCAPAERWSCDVLELEGERRLREVVDYIKAGCELV